MLVIFAPLVVTYLAFRTLRRKFDRRSLEEERHLQLLEVRRLQQEKYGRTSYDDYDSDSDSDSVDGDGAPTGREVADAAGDGAEEKQKSDAADRPAASTAASPELQ